VLPLGAGGSLFALVCGYQPGLVAFELESEREQFTAETIRYERDRIARELHDVIAHSVSIIVIQASAGQRLPPGDPGSGELPGNIAELAREAAADISGLTGLLTPVLEHPLTRKHIEDLLAPRRKPASNSTSTSSVTSALYLGIPPERPTASCRKA
jgi:signal transduction histidine kinase